MSWTLGNYHIMAYLDACEKASKYDVHFENFKQDPAYRHVLEHVSKEEAEMYLDQIKINFSRKLSSIKKNDQYGNPDIYEFNKVGLMSPTTIRYLKNTSDIVYKFGKKIKSIIEIGGGYGGLSTVLYPFIKYESYLIVDLYEVNLLSRRYLKNFDCPVISHQYEEIELDEGFNFDLLISNYAFSECERDVQMNYINKFVRRSKKFYMIFNDFGPDNIHHKEFIEIMSDQFDVDIEPDHTPDSPVVLYGHLK